MTKLPRINVGDRFSRWLVVGPRDMVANGPGIRCSAWACVCDCGSKAMVRETKLKSGTSQSCGCLVSDVAKQTRKAHPKKARHGMCGTPTYTSWFAMLQRCTNPKNKRWDCYGGRGITVCERWKLFDNFLSDMGVRPEGKTIDRINVNANYEPTNCRWATAKEQRSNQRIKGA